MRFITLAAVAALGVFTLDALGRKRQGTVLRPSGLAGEVGSGQGLEPPASTRASEPSLPDSPNAAERLQAHHAGGSLGDAAAQGLGLSSPDDADVEYPRSTGLADFARGA